MSEWKCAEECRWVLRAEPSRERAGFMQDALVLQQKWKRKIPFNGRSFIDEKWRDVPRVDERKEK